MANTVKSRIRWIDCAKAMAILAVVTDHCSPLLYENVFISRASYFSVSLFILLSGISAWVSSGNGKDVSYRKQGKRIGRLFASYAVATFFIIVTLNGSFDARDYLTRLAGFSGMQTMYYLFILFQLMLVSPLLVQWCEACNRRARPWLWHGATLLVLGAFGSLCERYTFMLPLVGGGKYLFGATYLFLYDLGVVLASRKIFEPGKAQRRGVPLAILAGVWAVWLTLWCRESLPLDGWLSGVLPEAVNPPGVSLMVYALLTLLLCYYLFTALESAGGFCLRIAKGLAWLGRYTLPIFLYHLLIRDWMAYNTPWAEMDVWLGRVFFIVPMVFLPVLGAWLTHKAKGMFVGEAAGAADPDAMRTGGA